MNLLEHLDKNNLHHAYLIEGERDEIVPEILSFCENLNIKTSGNPDFYHIAIDNFKMKDALDLRAMGNEKSFFPGKKIFVVCSNSFTLDAEGALLKMFEEPTENTHFFLVVPDINSLLKTLVSRFYIISTRQPARQLAGGDLVEKEKENAEKFINMSLQKRIDFIKELLPKKDEEDAPTEVGVPTEVGKEFKESNSSKALKFLNALEAVLHHKIFIQGKDKNPKENPATLIPFRQIFLVRKFLRQPGSSAKTLMESVALIIPNL